MKKVLQGLFSVKAFRNNYLAAAATTALFLLSHVVYAQPNSPSASAPKYDTTRILQPINADGFYWTGVGKFGGGLVLPNDTFHLSIQSKGALAYKNGKVYEYEGHYWEEAGFKRWFVSPDGSINITNNGDTIKATVTGAPNSSSPGNYIITYPTIERSNDTVDVIPNIVFQQGALRDTITTGAQYIVPYASADQKRIDAIFVNPSGLLDTAQGIEDSFFAVRPDLAAGSIVIADINVYGTDSIVVSNVGTFQRTAMGYFDANGKLTGDSTKYFVGSNTLNAPSFKSNVVGGVALSIDGGSAIRAERGSRIVYIDGDSSVTLRSGGYNHKAQLTAQGEFLIGSPGQVRIPSARLAVIDSTKGFLPPVMRGVRMNAISSPATGLEVYNTDSSAKCYFNGTNWRMNTLQHAFDLDQDRIPQINAHGKQFRMDSISYYQVTTTDIPNYGYINVYPQGIGLYTGDTTTGMPQTSIDASHSLIALTSRTGGIPNSLVIDSNVTYLTRSTSDSFVRFGINTDLPDSALHVIGGVAMPNLYESSDVTDSMVVKNADGGLGIRAIPGGGSTTDSVQIGNDWYFSTKVTLTPTDILTLNTVPVEAIAAPGAGKAIDVISVSGRLVPNSVSYSTGVNPTIICNAVNLFACPFAMNESATIGSKFTPESAIGNFIENAPVFISSTADEQDGDGNLIVYLYYRIITL